MRKAWNSWETTEGTNSTDQILESLSELRKRIEKLERQVFPYGPERLDSVMQRSGKGRKPKLETKHLLQRRESLTTWIEQNWPRISVAMRKAESSSNPAIAITAMVAAKEEGIPGVFQPPFYDAPEEYEAALGEFLKSGRFHGNPRNLAAAMAGLPELSWKRSFDICIKHPYKGGVALEAYRDYMKRKFPDRFRELIEAQTITDVKIVLDRSRSIDPVYLHFKEPLKNSPSGVQRE